MLEFNGVSWNLYDYKNSLIPFNGEIVSIAIDSNNNKWIGTSSKGLLKYDGIEWVKYDSSLVGLPTSSIGVVKDIRFDSNQNLWLISNGLSKFDGSSWTHYTSENTNLTATYLNHLTIDQNDDIWIGTYFNGILYFKGDTFKSYNTSNSTIPHNQIYDVEVDIDNNIWASTPYGVVNYNGIVWSSSLNLCNSALPDHNASKIYADKDGLIWFGSDEGLVKYGEPVDTCEINTILNITIYQNDSLIVGGRFQKASGIYYDTIESKLGCDSIITTHLKVTEKTIQPPGIEWSKVYGGSNYDYPKSIIQTSTGEYLFVGSTRSSDIDVNHDHNPDSVESWLLKLNINGDTLWTKCFGGNRDDMTNSVIETSDGNYLMVGASHSVDGDLQNNNGIQDLWIYKTDTSGQLLWSKNYGGTDRDGASEIAALDDGNYIVVGTTLSNDLDVHGAYGSENIWILKINLQGDTLWTKAISNTRGYFVMNTSDSNILIAGQSNYDYYIVKLDYSGDIIWSNNYGGSGWDFAESIAETDDGDYIVAGFTYSNDGDVHGMHGIRDYWIIKLTSEGDTVWTRCFGGSGYDQAYSIVRSKDNSFIIVGRSDSEDGDVTGLINATDFWVVKINESSDILWTKCLGGFRSEIPYKVINTVDDGYVIIGDSYSNDWDVRENNGISDFWVVKLKPEFECTNKVVNIDTTINQGDTIYFNGEYITEEGVYTDTLQTINGCDSIIILNLTFEPEEINDEHIFSYSTTLYNENDINYIIPDVNDSLYAFTSFGYYKLPMGSSLESDYQSQDQKIIGPINTVELRNDTIWIGSNGEIKLLYNNKITSVDFPSTRSIYDIEFDSKGNIWVATWADGLFKYDGITWQNFTKDDDGLVDHRVTAITIDENDGVWIGYHMNGIGYLDSSGLKNFTEDEYNDRPFDVKQMCWKDNILWIACWDGLYKFKDTTLYKVYESEPITSFIIDNNDTIWLCTYDEGLLKANINDIQDRPFWTIDESAFISEPNEFTNYTNTISLDKNGVKWIATYKGLLYYDTKWEIISKESLIHNRVNAIKFDSKNNAWIGTSRGVSYLKKSQWHNFDLPELNEKLIYDLYLTDDNNLWISADDSIMQYVFDTNLVSLTRIRSFNLGSQVNYIAADINYMYFGTGMKGFFKYNYIEWDTINQDKGLINNNIRNITPHDSILWITSLGGISKIKNGIITNYEKENDIPVKYTYDIAIDTGNNVWFSCDAGLLKYVSDTFKQYPFSNQYEYFYDIYIDDNNRKWIGEHGGVWLYKEQEDSWIDISDSTWFSNETRDINLDQNGNIWYATYYGINIIDNLKIVPSANINFTYEQPVNCKDSVLITIIPDSTSEYYNMKIINNVNVNKYDISNTRFAIANIQNDSIAIQVQGVNKFYIGEWTDTLQLLINLPSTMYDTLLIENTDSVLLEGEYQSTSGIYYDTLLSSQGCDSIIITNLTVYTPILFTTNNETCQGDLDGSIEVEVSGGVEPYSYLWSTGDTIPNISGLGAGMYILTVTDANDSIKIDSVEITTTLMPIAQINGGSNDTSWICKGVNIALMASGGTNYIWSTGDNSSTINIIVDSSNTYTVTVTENGCSSETNHFVGLIEDPLISEITGDTVICGGTYYNYSVFEDISLSYYWWIEGPDTNKPSLISTNNTTKLILNSSPWEGKLFAQSFNGCYSDTASLPISVISAPEIITQDDEVICKGDTVLLTASSTETLVWNTGDTASTIKVAPAYSTPYYVSASNGNCTVTKNINVFVYQIPAPPYVYDETIRESDSIPEFMAIGKRVIWYGDEILSNILDTGNYYQPIDSLVGEYKYYVTQSNKYCESAPSISTFIILEDNYPPVIKDSIYYITENNEIEAIVGRVESSDKDADQILSHFITEIIPTGAFDITEFTGDILAMEQLNYEQDTAYNLKVVVQDNSDETASDTADIQIVVLNANEAPEFIGNQLFRIYGVLSVGDYIGTLTAIDPDGDNIYYYLFDNSVDDLFAVIDSTGDIVSAADTVLARTNQYAFLVKAQDDAIESLWTQSLVTVIIDSSTLEPPVENPVSIDEIINIDEIKIFPNPANEELYVQLPEKMEKGTLELITFNGQLLYSSVITSENVNPVKVSLQEIENGMYFIRIVVGDENYQFKFIKE
ncbi:cadherin domain-containing protein [Bacteroidota bacterium]